MDMTMTPGFKAALPLILTSCGGTRGSMLNVAMRVSGSKSDDLYEILGKLLEAPGPMRELVETCAKTNGALDLEGLIRHFAGFEHTQKMTGLKATVANELPKPHVPLAHTLLPLVMVDGRWFYDCGEAYVEIVGLTQIGPTGGSPYAHLAGLIWLQDGGQSAQILAEQAENGVAAAAAGIKRISYHDAPILREGTIAGVEVLQDLY